MNRFFFCLSCVAFLTFAAMPIFTAVSDASELKVGAVGSELTDLSLEELMDFTVFGASKYDQRINEAPSSVSIITEEEIKRYGYRTFAEVLRSIRGFYTAYDRNYSYIGVRGFGRPGDYNTRLLVLVDGHRMNDSVYDGVYTGTEFILDVDLIDRIEVIRGPGSSLYGSNAFFGVINVITKQGRYLKGTELAADAGSFGTYRGRATYGNRFQNGIELLVSGTAYASQGQDLYFSEYDTPESGYGKSRDTDFDRFNSAFLKAAYGEFTFSGAYVMRKKGVPTGSYGTLFGDPRTNTKDDRGYLSLKYDHVFPDKTAVTARAYYDDVGYRGDYSYDYPPVTQNKDYSDGQWWGGEVQVVTRLMERHKVIAGAEFRTDINKQQGNYDEDPYFRYLDDTRKDHNWAVFAQDEITLGKSLVLSIGIRHDWYESFGGTTSPRLAVVYNLQKDTTIKLLYGEAFRVPNAYELYYDDSGLSTRRNPDLDPEKIRTYELVFEQNIGEHLRFVAVGYVYRIRDLITQTVDPGDGLIVFENADRVRGRGIEFEVEGKWPNGIEGRASYAVQETEDEGTEEGMTNSPKYMGKLNVTVPLWEDRLYSGVEFQYTSKRKTLQASSTGGFGVVNVTVSAKKFIRGLEASASVYNLFDKKYGDPGSAEHLQDSIEQDGRTFRVKLTYAF